MEKYPPSLIQPNIDTGSPRHFDALRQGYQLLDRYRKTLAKAENAPMSSARGDDQDGEPSGIHENLAPWDAVEEAAQALAESQAARSIMQAHPLTVEPLSPEGGVVIRNAEGYAVSSREMPVFIKNTGREQMP
jgi:hypothetical protein